METPQDAAYWNARRALLRRLLQYREWLTRRDGFTTEQAAEVFEITSRTVYRDVEHLREMGWDVSYCRRSRRWELVDGHAPLPLPVLREGEVLAMLVAEQALRAYSGTPYVGALKSAFEKLISILDMPVRLEIPEEALPRFVSPPVRRIVSRQFQTLVRACCTRRQLELTYHSFESNRTTERRVDPYQVFAHAGDWYLAAYDHRREEFRTFALGERMREIRELNTHFSPDPEFDLQRYLAEGFGLFRGGPVEEVVLRFTPNVARYLCEKVWDETEVKQLQADGSLLLRIRVPINVGLQRFVLQYGADVEVLAPASFREVVADVLRSALSRYTLPEADY